MERKSRRLITYSVPVKNCLVTRGVAFYTTYEDGGDYYYEEAKIVLSENHSKLAEYLANVFIKERGLK